MTVNFLWIGTTLGLMERLTLTSFLHNDHTPVLWLYDKKCKGIPKGVKIKDAGEILHPSKVFAYTGNGDCRKGSYGGFSDIFRYHLLYKTGEWYCDMDVTCLKNFSSIKQDYVFRPHPKTKVVGNIMKTPKECEVMKACIDITESEVTPLNDRWIKPLEILNEQVEQFNLTPHICSTEWFGLDDSKHLQELLALNYFIQNIKLPKYAIHWCNEAITTGQWNKSIKRDWNVPIPSTLYYNLLKDHKLI